ncbi:SEC10/PgrA surface exclusion domain-containing protein [Limosilactobacillus reuteri]|uniref:LPXTG-motif cell wall anchor domain protein n=1 Tax=Limosilactobacillus reuteri subsp. rodentium (strain DSM 17509 / CIP 109821 / 100-23) TaxID=349123 RepID=B3XP00_LIMR1|nr:SEC10/PgrA surface exclusion domain-containing protein [Limosilactobacillus reuteri]EDX43536.1 LPXTG-motif cell wall anchor domain protein [Limosilactobacillus reuteri subsp. rodentium]MCC4475776.1 SEC10/PgrA surface exclusion domain-containing protein [Limosilactobacillus reuteri]
MPKQKNSHKILKSVALAGALTATGAVATTAHADTVATSTAATSATTTDQQLANMKSAHVATESAAAASNAAAMNSATTSANSQIADLNNQIQTRQASDAAMQQASQASAITSVNQAATSATDAENASYSQAVASQTAANNAALKSAQATIVTEQQKNQETAQENADYQNQAGNLDSQHNATLNQLDQALKNNTDGTNFAIQKEISRQKTDEQGAIDRAAKQFDSQISAADTEVGKAQQTVNADQDVVNAKDAANKAAQQAVKNAQDKLSGAQDALKKAEASVNDVTTDSLNVPQDYINVWKEFANNNYGWLLTKDQHPDLWQRNANASTQAKSMNTNFHASEADKTTPVHFNSDGTLSRADAIIATQYATELLNPIREAIGMNPLKITNASIDMTSENASKYRAKDHNDWQDSHDGGALLTQIAQEWGCDNLGESLAGNQSLATQASNGETVTVADLKGAVYQAVIDLLFEGADGSDNGHTTDLLGVRYANGSKYAGGSDFLGVTYDYDNNGNGWIRFNSIPDGHGEHTAYMKAHHYKVKSGSSEDKTIQGSNYDQIAIPSANHDDQIKQLQAAVATDTQALNDAKTKASTTASELKSAQDKLASDQAKLSQAQKRVTELRTNKENTLKAMATDPMQSPQVKQLQAKLAQARVDHDNGVKAENAQYAAKAKDLKTKHEAKLAAIAAQPTSLAELQSQLQAKLDTLKAQHEAKIKQITDDANAKIAAIKNQKVADPKIDKLNAQIAQIKSDLAKKQQELDSQYEALKTKNQAEYDALAKKLHESDKAVVNGDSDQYKTADGKTVVMAGGKNAGGSVATTTSVKNAVATTVKVEPETSSVEMTREAYKAQQAKLPQTGNNNSTALIALGAIASMFGFGLVAKKKQW